MKKRLLLLLLCILPLVTLGYNLKTGTDFQVVAAHIQGNIQLNTGGSLSGVKVTYVTNTSQVSEAFTDEFGNYSMVANAFTDGVLTASKTGYDFNPASVTITYLTNSQEGFTANFVASVKVFTVSGRILLNNQVAANVDVALGSTSTKTDGNGNYSLSVLYGASGKVTPSKSDCIFEPDSYSFSNITSNLTANFTMFTVAKISGLITYNNTPLIGVTVNLTGGNTLTTGTGNDGMYSFIVKTGFNYTVTPSMFGYIFNPEKKDFANLQTAQAQNFSANKSVTLSGNVTFNGAALSNVTITYSGSMNGSTLTKTDGTYIATLQSGGNYTITPAKLGYIFTPTNASISNMTENRTQNFTAKIDSVTISGTIKSNGVPLDSVSVILSGDANKTILTNTTGVYSFKVACFGNYTITPSKQYYTFQTINKSFSNVTTAQVQDFAGLLNNITINGTILYNLNPLENVTVYLTGSTSGVAFTSSNGKFSFSVPILGNYTIRPEKQLFSFSPVNFMLTRVTENTTLAFTAKYIDSINISGIVKQSDGTPVKNVLLKLTGNTFNQTFSNETGYYSLRVPSGYNYTVSPSLACYTFNPKERSYENITTDQINQHFYASCDTLIISGIFAKQDNTPLAGIKVFDYNGKSIVTDTAGRYSFKALTGTNVSIVPSVLGYRMVPPNYVISGIKNNQTLNFKTYKAAITILWPDTTKKAEPNDTLRIKWSYSGIDSGRVTITFVDLVRGNNLNIASGIDIKSGYNIWNTGSLRETGKGAVVIKLEPNQPVFDTSDIFRVYLERQISSLTINNRDSVEYGKTSIFTWQSQGNIDTLLFMVREGNGPWNYVKRIPNTGIFSWKVDFLPSDQMARVGVRLVDKTKSQVTSGIVDFNILCKAVVTASLPANDPTYKTAVSVIPSFTWNCTSLYAGQRAEKIIWMLKVSEDSLFRSSSVNDTMMIEERMNLTGNRSYNLRSQLGINKIYFYKIIAYYLSNFPRMIQTESPVTKFKTENLAPLAPLLVSPSAAYTLDDKDSPILRFEWTKPLRAGDCIIQTATDSTFRTGVATKTISNDNFTTLTLNYIPNTKIFWRVKSINSAGEGPYSNYNIIYMMASSVNVAGYTITSENWENFPDGTLKGSNPTLKQTSKNYLITVKNGWIKINKDKTKIDTLFGEVYCPVANTSLPVCSGFFTANSSTSATDPLCIIPASTAKNIITKTNSFGLLPLNTLHFIKIDLAAGKLFFKYDKLTINVPGIRVVDTRTEKPGDTVHFHTTQPLTLDAGGNFSGKVDNYMIQSASILLIMRNVAVLGSATTKVNFTSSDYSVNYYRLNNNNVDFPGVGKLIISSDNTIDFENNFCNFPDLNLDMLNEITDNSFPIGFELPSMKYRKDEISGNYVMDIDASVTLPFCFSTSSASGSGQGTSSSEVGTGSGCNISGGASLTSTAPYFQGFRFAASGCWEIEIAPFLFWTGLSGNMSFYANDQGKINNFGVGGSVDLELSVPPTIISGTNGFKFDSRGYLELYGESKLFGKWPLAETSLKFDWTKRDGLAISGSYDMHWLLGMLTGHLAGGIEISKNSFGQGWPNMFFDGYVDLTIPAKIIKFCGINLPRKAIPIGRIGAQVGRFTDDGVSKGFGFQAYMRILSLFDLAVFLPFQKDGKVHFGFDKYDLITFQRSLAMRRKGKSRAIENVPYYTLGVATDTLNMYVPDTPADTIFFVIGATTPNPPTVLAIDPNNKSYESQKLLEANSYLLADSGYIMPVKNVKGTWKLIVDKIEAGSDYNISLAANNIKPSISIDDLQKTSNTQYKIKYTAKDPDSQADISFYYVEDTASNGKLINTEPIKEKDRSDELIFDVSNFKNGNYKIYALVNDGTGPYVKSNYSNIIKILNIATPAKPSNLNIFRLGSNKVKLTWDNNSSANSYNLYTGYTSGIYQDTILNLFNNSYTFTSLNDTNVIYAIVTAVSVNKIRSQPSNEIKISLSSAISDSNSPSIPDAPTASAILNSNPTDTAREYIVVNWNPVAGASGYILYYTNKGNDKFAYVDVKNRNSIELEHLTRGTTYILKVKAYGLSGISSPSSSQSEVNFYSLLDADNDGMPDDWEVKYFNSISVTNSLNDDTDGDGLKNTEEMELGTNPNNTDSDGDGVWDDVDSHPLADNDYNGNGIGDDYEVYYEITDPNADDDKDGLSNLLEYRNRTNPKNPDTDGGGLSDGEEVTKRLNPLDPNDDKWIKGFVQLQSFNGKFWKDIKTQKDTIVLVWKTKKEQDVKGFYVFRKSLKDQYYQAINIDIIPPINDTIMPHTYTYKDGNVESGMGYTYYIEGLSKWGNKDSLGVYTASNFTKIEEIKGTIPDKVELYQNYPNPFNPTTNIQFSVASDAYVTLKIYDMLGREVMTLVDKNMKTGLYSLVLDGHSLSSGQYFYRLKCGNFIQTKSMLLVR